MKKWYQSKLLWLGIITGITSMGDVIVDGGDWKTIVMGIIGVLVTVFRVVTTKQISA